MGNRYTIKYKMLSVPAKVLVQNEAGEEVYEADRKIMTLAPQMTFKDVQGREIYQLKRVLVSMHDGVEISQGDQVVATLNKALVSFPGPHIVIKTGGEELQVRGDITSHEYQVLRGEQQVAQISKHWVTVADTVGVEINPGENEPLIIASTVCINMMMGDNDRG